MKREHASSAGHRVPDPVLPVGGRDQPDRGKARGRDRLAPPGINRGAVSDNQAEYQPSHQEHLR